MGVKPMIRSNICLNACPEGCEKAVRDQIGYVKKMFGGRATGGPRLALVIGCSTGYGLASRIAAGFGYGAATVGISFEKAPTESRVGTPGYYNNAEYDKNAAAEGLASVTLDGDAFSDEMKERAVAAVKEAAARANIKPEIDLVIYSLASPVRTDPKTRVMHKSVIKPIGQKYAGRTFDLVSGAINEVAVNPASDEEIANTVKVMGGEDWELWIDALEAAGVLSPRARTVAYTYIGPRLSWAIYKNGTIGRAKEDLERAGKAINKQWAGTDKAAWVSVNKAVVTRASAVIPIIPLYIGCLFKVMKAKGLHEGCIEQIVRLYRDRLYTEEAAADPHKVAVDSENRIRIDDWEMREDVQAETEVLLAGITAENITTQADIAGFRHDFLEAHGFDVAGVDEQPVVAGAGV
ncbi:MAG: trans-2-enoyl-CoA reductase family protein [Spirochaetaceae bacterium]|jgi:enoyl-[acyl-carrier protein] reductase/trans-2-enoyl-CoA reductase (NAD+)|nr:trans-2-enoyl-CoA reductase family protein [Spirochaetaceae bacterium]